jgi:formylglycine-generating enzyme required for sulfatase activity/tRNA A-37 threonylcarbamoyl transferase component Bud32
MTGGMAGLQIGGYTLERLIGSGGMAAVYLGVHAQTGARRAIKVIRADLAQDEHFRTRFWREVDLLAKLEHPNIVRFYAAHEVKDELLAMELELLTGKDLRDVLLEYGDAKMPPDVALEWLRQAAEGVAFAHRREVIHRDLKLDNLFLCEDGTVKVLDFGIARARDEAERIHATITQDGRQPGTPGYIAPETCRGETPTPAADVYALGICLFELLLGYHPLNPDRTLTPLQIMLAQIQQPLPSLGKLRRDLSPALVRIADRAVSLHPADRYEDADALLIAVMGLKEDDYATVPASRLPQLPPAVAARPRRSIVIALALVCVVIAAILAIARPKPVIVDGPSAEEPTQTRQMALDRWKARACLPGQQREAQGFCCWPGQHWDGQRCAGTPTCPERTDPRGGMCTPPKPPDAVAVAPGIFVMGSPLGEPGRERGEVQREVLLTWPIWVKTHEVTQTEWFRLMKTEPSMRSRAECPDCPVERISWNEALAYLNALSEQDGLEPCYDLSRCDGPKGDGCPVFSEGGARCLGNHLCTRVVWRGLQCNGWRLPTEAEWERLAQGTDPASAHRGARTTVPVATRAANAYGLHDMLGNVREWVWDCQAPYEEGDELWVDPIAPAFEGCERGTRGGGWMSEPAATRAAGARQRAAARAPVRSWLSSRAHDHSAGLSMSFEVGNGPYRRPVKPCCHNTSARLNPIQTAT